MRRLLSAFLISLSITIGAFVLLSIAANFSEGSIIEKLLSYAAFVPYAPIGLILDALFRGPDHSGVVFVVAVVLMLFFYTIVSWLVMTVLGELKRRSIRAVREASTTD